jgi:hypothetical protein
LDLKKATELYSIVIGKDRKESGTVEISRKDDYQSLSFMLPLSHFSEVL